MCRTVSGTMAVVPQDRHGHRAAALALLHVCSAFAEPSGPPRPLLASPPTHHGLSSLGGQGRRAAAVEGGLVGALCDLGGRASPEERAVAFEAGPDPNSGVVGRKPPAQELRRGAVVLP